MTLFKKILLINCVLFHGLTCCAFSQILPLDIEKRGFFVELPKDEPIKIDFSLGCIDENTFEQFIYNNSSEKYEMVYDNYKNKSNSLPKNPDRIIQARLHATNDINIFLSFTNLYNLSLSGGDFNNYDFRGLENLSCLSVIFAEILGLNKVPNEFCKLSNLKKLRLSNNRIRELPSCIFEHPTLKYLSFFQQWSDTLFLPSDIEAKSVLYELNLSKCNLYEIPEGFFNLPTLERLVLGNCKIRRLPEDISGLKGLRMLDLENTPLEELPESISKLDNLITISLRNTKLSQFPEVLFKVKNIRHIYLTGTECTQNAEERIKIMQTFEELGKKDVVIFW